MSTITLKPPLEDTGIHIRDEYYPEDIAMMQALYSRSPDSVLNHEEKVKHAGSEKFMDQYYVKYDHKSIGDCGTTTIFVEGVSMITAKILQDWQLYSGQEASTRYLDWSNQSVIDPLNTELSKSIIQKVMNFYAWAQPKLVEFLKQKYAMKEGETEKQYTKAIAARSFDILRGFLPSGAQTNLSWHTNLRQAGDKLQKMMHHPLPEARMLAERILSQLQEKYTGSFNFRDYPEGEEYTKMEMGELAFYDPWHLSPPSYVLKKDVSMRTQISAMDLIPFQKFIDARPKYMNLPVQTDELGMITWEFLLDFGSFRDVQRHRKGVCRIPKLTVRYGFEPWYLEQLSPEIYEEAEKLLCEIESDIVELGDILEAQYYVPMGYRIPCKNTYGLMATVYITELRSGKTVHPTMRKIAQGMHEKLLEKFPNLKLYTDLSEDEFSYKRGGQDIEKK